MSSRLPCHFSACAHFGEMSEAERGCEYVKNADCLYILGDITNGVVRDRFVGVHSHSERPFMPSAEQSKKLGNLPGQFGRVGFWLVPLGLTKPLVLPGVNKKIGIINPQYYKSYGLATASQK